MPERTLPRDLRWYIGVGVGLGLLILAFHGLIFLVGGYLPASPIDGRSHLIATSTFTSAILSYFLIILYYNIAEIQSDQTEILEHQQKPKSVIKEWGTGVFPEAVPLFGPYTREQLYFDIENTGLGQALELQVTLIVHPLDDINGFSETNAMELIRTSEPTSPLRRPSVKPHTTPQNYLAQGKEARFFGNVFYWNEGEVKDAYGTILGYHSPDYVFIAIKVDYTDIFDEEYSILPITAIFDVRDKSSLDETLTHEYEQWVDIEPGDATAPSNYIENIDYDYPISIVSHEEEDG